ncbi:MAG: hypothetical protein WCJ01_09365 [Ignavibacteria bacterium]
MKKQELTFTDICSNTNERLISYMRGLERLRLDLEQMKRLTSDERVLSTCLDELFRTAEADMMALTDILYEIEVSDGDYMELADTLAGSAFSDGETIN